LLQGENAAARWSDDLVYLLGVEDTEVFIEVENPGVEVLVVLEDSEGSPPITILTVSGCLSMKPGLWQLYLKFDRSNRAKRLDLRQGPCCVYDVHLDNNESL
jgi:hypothetical protein